MKLRWDLWLYGLVSAVIGGGSGAVTNASAASWVAPETFNLVGGFHKTMTLMGVTFIVSGAIAFFAYLKEHPAPAWDASQPDRRGTNPGTQPAPKVNP